MKSPKKRTAAAWITVGAAAALLTAALVGSRFPDIAAQAAALIMDAPQSSAVPAASQPASSAAPQPESEPESASSADASSAAPEPPAESTTAVGGTVTEVDLSLGGNLIRDAIRIKSKSASTIDIDALRAQPVELQIADTDAPQVLIYHTHTSEAYLDEFTGTYPADFDVRTRDTAHSVVRVGDAIAEKLNAAGITTIHDTAYHDDPMYRGAYGRSLQTVAQYRAAYPSIVVTLDVHRDCLQQADGTRLKPTVTVNGQKAAQIMLVSGCDDNGTLGFPDWRKNMCFSIHLQDILTRKYTGLARPIYCWNVRYNEHVTPTSLLVEFGTEANTDEEAAYSGALFADALIELLNEYRAQPQSN